MSFKVRDLVLACRGLPGGQKHVLAAMAHWAKDDGCGVYPRVEQIADRCGMSVRQVQRCIRAMADAGILEAISRASGKRGQANHWNIKLDVLTGARVSICHPTNGGGAGSCGSAGDGCQNVTPSSDTGDSSGSDGCHFGIGGVTLVSPPIETDQVRTDKVTGKDAGAREPVQRALNLMLTVTGDKPAYPAGFELVWSDLAKCPGFTAVMGKHEAFLAYEAIPNREADAELCRAARIYGRHLGDLNRQRAAHDPHPMRSPVRWFSTGYYRQFLGKTDMSDDADSPKSDTGVAVAKLREAVGEKVFTALQDCGLSDGSLALLDGIGFEPGSPAIFTVIRPAQRLCLTGKIAADLRRHLKTEFEVMTVAARRSA